MLGAARGHTETRAVGFLRAQFMPSVEQQTVPVSDSMNIGVVNGALFSRHLHLISRSAWLPLVVTADSDDVLTGILNPDIFSSLS